MKRRSSILSLFLASTMLCGLAAGAGAQELVTADRIGLADAPKSMTFRTNPPFTHTSPTPARRRASRSSSRQFAQNHPDWQINIEYFTPDIGGEHARMLEQARAGRAPDCATVDSFQLALFIKQGALAPVDGVLHPGRDRRPLPVHQGRNHRSGRQHSMRGGGTPTSACSIATRSSSRTRRRTGPSSRRPRSMRRRRARKACSSTAAAGKAPPSTGSRSSGRRAASSSTTAASRSSAKAKIARRC